MSIKQLNLLNEEILTEATIDEIYTKYYSDIPREDFDNLVKLDPTYNPERDANKMGEFTKWLIGLYKKKEDLSDETEIKDQLRIFKSIKNKIPPENRDIMRYKTLKDFFDFVYSTDVNQKTDLQVKAESHPGAKFVCKTDAWEVYEPTTYEASKWLRGDDANWCTGRAGDRSYYDSYTRDGGRLFIFINRKKDENDLSSKYQVAISKDDRVKEFRDARNSSADFINFISDDSLYKALGNTDISRTSEYKAVKELKSTNGTITYSRLMAIKFTGDKYNGGSESSLYQHIVKQLKKIIINDGIAYLKEESFKGFPILETVIFPDSVRYFGEDLFKNCPKLKEINIPNKVTIIPTGCFAMCTSLERVNFGTNVVEFKTQAFKDCNPEVVLATPPHKMKVPLSEKDWYLSHLERIQPQEESLQEALSETIPAWIKPFLPDKSDVPYGYGKEGWIQSTQLGKTLHNNEINLNTVEIKNKRLPQTKQDLISILNNKEKELPIFFIPKDERNAEILRMYKDNRNGSWRGDAKINNNIIYIPGVTNPAIGSYASDEFEHFSNQRLFNILKDCKNVKFATIDLTNPKNVTKDIKAARAELKATKPAFDRERDRGQGYVQTYYVRKRRENELSQELLDNPAYKYFYDHYFINNENSHRNEIPYETKQQVRDFLGRNITHYIGYNDRQNLPQEVKNILDKSTDPGEFRVPAGLLYKYDSNLTTSKLRKNNEDRWYGSYDKSGYSLSKVKDKVRNRLADYRKEHYLETLDKITKSVTELKDSIANVFSDSMSDLNPTSMRNFRSVISDFEDIVDSYNNLISELDFTVLSDKEEDKEALLNKIFATDRYKSGNLTNVKELIGKINELKKRVQELETTYIESLKK